METLTVELRNPKAKKLLENLEEMELITIKQSWTGLTELRERLRARNQPPLTLEDITEEAEAVRAGEYAAKQRD